MVSLALEGRSVIERVFPAHAAHVVALMGGLMAEEQETLGALCEKLAPPCLMAERSLCPAA